MVTKFYCLDCKNITETVRWIMERAEKAGMKLKCRTCGSTTLSEIDEKGKKVVC